ncbi:S49 family peptidase [Eleftheria terrae]|uniref:S49 family peptidase n=1 Tax=Eleftheria terrae TaxID=1597781 RepID=UPI00263B970C|nr:S49 family peptidase [Eleftheria terrae]WKB50865.1 S49 family peptidase [Eleftheria terrae]
MSLPYLASRLYGTPLLITRSKLDVILAVLGSRLGWSSAEAYPALPVPRTAASPPAPGIALIPIHGTLVRRSMGLEAASGLTSYAEIGARLDAALADPEVKGILLDVDSPGGEAGGVFELAQRIRTASRSKPVWAHANDAAYSAAYAIAAAASRLTLSQTAGVGSIGVIALHVDQSAKDLQDGLAYRAVYAGHHKNDFSPHAPLTPEAASALQTEVDRLYGIFVGSVAQMRGLSEDAVQATEARLLFGHAAVDAGLADAVLSLDAVQAEFAAHLAGPATLLPSLAAAMSRPASASPSSSLTEHSMHSTDLMDPPADAVPPATAALPSAAVSVPVAAAAYRNEAHAIAELCLIAGAPGRTAEFLGAGMTQDQVRRVLLDARASQPEISSRITADAGTSASASPESNPLMSAVKKLISRS